LGEIHTSLGCGDNSFVSYFYPNSRYNGPKRVPAFSLGNYTFLNLHRSFWWTLGSKQVFFGRSIQVPSIRWLDRFTLRGVQRCHCTYFEIKIICLILRSKNS